jgi:hypothetical protein
MPSASAWFLFVLAAVTAAAGVALALTYGKPWHGFAGVAGAFVVLGFGLALPRPRAA